jgi:hypothetical protein
LLRSANNENSWIFLFVVCGKRIAAPIVLAQHKEHERLGKVVKLFCPASSTGIKIAKLVCCTAQKCKFVQYKVYAYYMTKKMSSAAPQANS